jgi:pimeloyl-ACP methyl ester carboxylesterase
MGGPIAATFSARYPERVAKLVLIGPAGARPSFPKLLKIFRKPVIGEAVLGLVGRVGIVKHVVTSDLCDKQLVGHFQERFVFQMQFKGYKRALLSTVRNNMLESFISTYRSIGALNKPTLLFWGRKDTTVPLAHSEDICAAIPNIEFHIIEDCSHIPHYEKPEETNAILLDFLRKS